MANPTEEKIRQDLIEKFAFLNESIVIKRERRIFVDVGLDKWAEVFDYLVKNMKVNMLCAVTGLDEGNNLCIIYHLSKGGATMVNLKVRLGKDKPSINTITSYFPSADIYERELMDLLGINIVGLAQGQRYPLSDNRPKDEFPLRKDWKGNLNQNAKGGQNA